MGIKKKKRVSKKMKRERKCTYQLPRHSMRGKDTSAQVMQVWARRQWRCGKTREGKRQSAFDRKMIRTAAQAGRRLVML